MRLIIIKIKNTIIPFCICLFALFLIVYSTNNFIAAKNGLMLWATAVVPSLFPFFIATELLLYTNTIQFLGKLLNKIMKPMFNVPGEGFLALIMGILSGYPIGARIVSSLKESGICSSVECERLIAFTNNSGPLFIIGTVGISLFSSQKVGIKLFIVHILSCIIVGFLFRWWKKDFKKTIPKSINTPAFLPIQKNYKTISFYNIGEILLLSIESSIKSILIIGGFVTLFSVFVSILRSSKILYVLSIIISPILHLLHIHLSYSNSIIIGLVEVTNGLQLAATNRSNISIIICSFLLGFGGISVFLQVLSITSKAQISIKPYIIGKLLQSLISGILMWILL